VLFTSAVRCRILNVYIEISQNFVMPQHSDQESEQAFSKLPDCGYSKKTAEAIWQWYHPSEKQKV